MASLKIPSNEDLLAYVKTLAGMYTTQVLRHALIVHGMWQSVCAVGIFDDGLQEVIDVAWRVLTTGIRSQTLPL